MRLNLYRAPTDNDGIEGLFPRHREEWGRALLDRYSFHLLDMSVEEKADRVTVTASGCFTVDSLYAGFLTKITYEIFGDGLLLTSVTGEPYGAVPDILPRIGVILETSPALREVEWLGRGRLENYADSRANAPIGRYRERIETMNTDYDYPQETGNREQTYALTLSGAGGAPLSVIGSDHFSFSYHDFTLENLTEARHRNEMCKSEKKYLYVDYRVRGLGSNSCGPEPYEQYRFTEKNFSCAIVIKAGQIQ
jgi:beta-galactosidase/evolved beta-galactosidase subunit alpha